MALFIDRAFMGIETETSEETARAFITGYCRALSADDRSGSGYILPGEEPTMRQLEYSSDAERAMVEYKGQFVK